MNFRFQKLYADLVTADGTVCVAYITSLAASQMKKLHAGVELYWPDGRREVVHARRVDPAAALAFDNEQTARLSFDVAGGPLVIEYEVEHGAWTPSGEQPARGLSWSVKAARANATARWLGEPARPVLHGVGYSDWVDIARPIRGLDLRRLRWGRIHLPATTIVYDAIDFGSGQNWRRAAQWHERGRVEYESFDIDKTSSGTRLTLGDTDSLVFDGSRDLHTGEAIDEARFPRAIERIASRVLAGRAVERRLLSRPRRGGWALHEVVDFGITRARAP